MKHLVGTLILAVALMGCGDKHDHDHDHAHGDEGPHQGMMAELIQNGNSAGKAELKLHDDKGDLELWLTTKDDAPLDIAIGSTVEVKFFDVGGEQKTVTLAARNLEKNEDEDGKANNRDGKTNYFIYPSKDGQDASWLQGKDFAADVQLKFNDGDTMYVSTKFKLVPHGLHGHDHSHD